MCRPLLLGITLLALLASPLLAKPGKKTDRVLRQKTGRFDADPGWDSHNNRVKVEPNPVLQDFGYSETNHAKGKSAGEMGGRVQRCTTPAFYGKRLASQRTFDEGAPRGLY